MNAAFSSMLTLLNSKTFPKAMRRQFQMFWLRSEGYACQEIWCTDKSVTAMVGLTVFNKEMLVKMTVSRPYGLILKASIKIKLQMNKAKWSILKLRLF